MRYLLALFLQIAFQLSLSAQDYAPEMRKIMSWFSPKNIQVNAIYEAYATAGDPRPMESLESVLIKQDTLQYLKMGSLEMVRGKNFGLNINGKDKTIVLENNSAQVKSIDPAKQMDFEALLKKCFKVELNTISEDLSGLYLFFPQGQYKQLTVYFNPKNHKPSKVETIYTVTGKGVFASSVASKLVVNYQKIIENPKVNSIIFTKANYVNKQSGKWKANEKYKEYNVTAVEKPQ